jgi:hypothetical protein
MSELLCIVPSLTATAALCCSDKREGLLTVIHYSGQKAAVQGDFGTSIA